MKRLFGAVIPLIFLMSGATETLAWSAVSPAPSATPTPGTGSAVAGGVRHWTLHEVLNIAFDNNPDLKSAEANYQATSKTIMEATSGYLPHVDLAAGLTETNLPSPSAGAASQVGIKLTYSSAVLNVNQTLFDFGRVLSKIDANRAQANSAEEEAAGTRNAVEVAVESAFYSVIATQKLLDAASRSLEQFQETYRTTAAMVRTGTRPAFDLTQANVQLARAKLGFLNAQNAHDLSQIALINLMGMTEQVEFQLEEPKDQDTVHSTDLQLSSMTRKALEFRPEMKSSEYSVKEARFRLHSEVTEYLPNLAFQGFYGTYQPNYPVAIRTAWGAGLALNWNLFDGLNTSSKVGELSYRLDQREALQEKEKDAIVAEVAGAFKELARSESQLSVANDALVSAQENASLARKRYQASVSTILELLVAESALVEAEGSAIEAKYQQAISLAMLKKAVNAPLKD